MQALAIFIVLISPLVFIFGLVNLIRPIKAARITRRRVGGFIMLGSVVAFMAGGLIGAATQPTAPTQRVADEVSAPNGGPMPAPPAQPEGVTQAEFTGMWTMTKNAFEPCDAQINAAASALQGGNAYAAYPVVEGAKSVCSDAHSALYDIALPRSAKGDVKKALQKAKEDCSLSGFLKFQAMDKMLKVVDGDQRPSAVSEATSALRDAGSSTMMCVAAYAGAAETAHLKLPEFEEAQAKAGT